MKTWCVVVAAGRGKRAGLNRNKVFFSIQGRTVLSRALDALSSSGCFEGIVLVLSVDDMILWESILKSEGPQPLVMSVVNGGTTRQESVLNGLLMLPEDTDIVAVHDAARPFVTSEIIKATIDSAIRFGSGVISTPVVDTIKQIQGDGQIITLPRETIRSVQTPQTFRYNMLLNAHKIAAQESFQTTDDAALFEKYYGTVQLVTANGAEKNIKLTRREDFHKYMDEMYVGCGYDAHRLNAGRRLILCGVEIPYEKGLMGHSDADVAVHALMDALLGAIGEGDIGRHFPDNNDIYKDISSMVLLGKTMEIIRDKGFSVANVDITIVAQKPKLAEYMCEMKARIVDALSCDHVNVKATTTEGMGFEGEQIGISAHAVALLRRNIY